jgi:hypothetical protein
LILSSKKKEHIAASGAIKPLVRALKTGSWTAKENAMCALPWLSQLEENKISIRQSGAIPLLVNLLETGGFHGKKESSMALYLLCSVNENKIRVVQREIFEGQLSVIDRV